MPNTQNPKPKNQSLVPEIGLDITTPGSRKALSLWEEPEDLRNSHNA